MSILKKLASESAIYGVSSVLGRILNYLLIFFHTEILATEAYGVISLFYTYAAFLNAIYAYGMETAFFRFVSDKDQDKQKVYSIILSMLLTTSLMFSALLVIFSSSLASWMGRPEAKEFVIYFACILAFDAIMMIPFARLRLKNKAKKFAFTKLFGIGINILLNLSLYVYFVFFRKQSELADYQVFITHCIFLANLIASASMLLALWKEFSGFRFQIDFKRFRPILNYAYPILFTSLAAIVNELLDRVLLEWWLPSSFYPEHSNTEIVGIYSACYKLSIFITLAVQAFKYAAEPFFFSQAADKNSPQVFAKILKFFVISCALMVLGVSFNLDILGTIFLRQESYREGLFVVPYLLMANTFLGIYYNLAVWFKVSKTPSGKPRAYFGTLIGVVGASVTLSLNLILIPHMGYLGSAIATLASYGSMMIVSYILGQRYYPIPYPIKRILLYLALTTGLVYVGLSVELHSVWLQKGFQLALILVFLGIVFIAEKKDFKLSFSK